MGGEQGGGGEGAFSSSMQSIWLRPSSKGSTTARKIDLAAPTHYGPHCTVGSVIKGVEKRNSWEHTFARCSKGTRCFGTRDNSLVCTGARNIFHSHPGTDRFITKSFNFLNSWFRELIHSVHGTDPFATQNAHFLSLYFRNRLAGSTEPIDLLHRTLNS